MDIYGASRLSGDFVGTVGTTTNSDYPIEFTAHESRTAQDGRSDCDCEGREGISFYDDAGKRYLEGNGRWSTALGFNEERLVEGAVRQIENPTCHIFNGRSNEF